MGDQLWCVVGFAVPGSDRVVLQDNGSWIANLEKAARFPTQKMAQWAIDDMTYGKYSFQPRVLPAEDVDRWLIQKILG